MVTSLEPRRRAALTIGTLVSALVLAGCVAQTHSEPVAATTARDQMTSLVQQTMQAEGGDWTALSDGPAATVCAASDGAPGVTFSWDQERPGASDPKALVSTVADAWTSSGYDVSLREDTIDDGRPLYAAVTVGRAVDSISVNASARRVSIEVQSVCGIGKIGDFE